MDAILPVGWADFTPEGLLALVFLFMLLGRIIPKPWHAERIADKDQQITYLKEALAKRDEQVDKLLENNELAANALDSIRREAARS